MSKECPPLTDSELDLAFRKGATDDDICAKLRDLFFWSYIVRNPLGRVVPLAEEAEQTASKMRSISLTSTQLTPFRR